MSDSAAQVDAWLEPLGDSPCGEDLEYDNVFLDLSKAAEGKPETQFSQAEPPDWSQVHELATSLFDRTRDIRVAILWGRAQLHREGLSVLPELLRLLRGLLDRYWAEVHPLPDPDDGDPYARLNVLAQLEDASTLWGDIRKSNLVRSRAIGQLSVRDLELAFERISPREDESAMSLSSIEQMLVSACQDNEPLRTMGTRAREELDGLLNVLDDKAGYGRGPACDELKSLLGAIQKVMPVEGAEGAGAEAVEDGSAFASEASSADDVLVARKHKGGGIGDSIDTRADAVKAIELVCQFLEQTEPTNPAQLLLRRAQRMIDKSFMELIRELAPESLNEVAKIMGVDPNDFEG
jgi:type VI secretion system protein ImpA